MALDALLIMAKSQPSLLDHTDSLSSMLDWLETFDAAQLHKVSSHALHLRLQAVSAFSRCAPAMQVFDILSEVILKDRAHSDQAKAPCQLQTQLLALLQKVRSPWTPCHVPA